MIKGRYSGVTLSEYAILLGLIVVVGVAGLSLLGSSTSELLGSASTGQAKKDMDDLVSLNFNGGGGNSSSRGGNGTSGGGQGGNNTGGELNLTESFGGGSNVSSAEGSTINVGGPATINQALEAAQKFEQLASEATDPAIKAWYSDAALRAYWLAGSQASFEVSGGKQGSPALTQMANLMGNPGPAAETSQVYQRNALQSISIWSGELADRQRQFLENSSISSAEKAQVTALIDSVLTSSDAQYGNAVRNNAGNARALLHPNPNSPEMARFQAIVAGASVEGQLGETPALQASVDGALALDAGAR